MTEINSDIRQLLQLAKVQFSSQIYKPLTY